MATDIERLIFKVELDGSAYLKGTESLSNSTKKLTESQEKANVKLAELSKTQSTYKKTLSDTNAILQANEKETLDLTKQLNALKDAQKGSSAEAIRLRTALRDTAVNTKELKQEALLLKNNITATTTALKQQTVELQKADKANNAFTSGLGKAYSGLSRIASFIPGLGIAGLVALISGPVIDAFTQWFDSINKTNDAMKRLQAEQDSFKGAESAFIKASETVNELRINVDLAKEGFIDKDKVVNQYNTTMGKTAGTVKTLDEVEQKLVAHGDAYIKMMLLKAAASFALGQAAKELFDAEEKRTKQDEEFITGGQKFLDILGGIGAGAGAGRTQATAKENERLRQEQNAKQKQDAINDAEARAQTFKDIAKKFQEDAAKISKDHQFNFFDDTKDSKEKIAKGRQEVANIYAQELQKLKSDIAKINEKGFTDESTITKAVEEDFKKRALAFEKAFKNKQLTAAQFTSLNDYLKNLQELTLAQNLKSFREQKEAYLKQIDSELNAMQAEETSKRIATIQDRFERERALIILETEKTINAIKEKRDKSITDIVNNAAKSGLTAADIAPQLAQIKDTYSKLLSDIEVIKNQKLQQLSFDTFQRLSEDAKRLLDAGNLGISQGSLINIKQQTELYQTGKISYKQYQSELTEIAKFEVNERFRLEKLFLQNEIQVRKDKLQFNVSLTSEQIKRLEDEIRRLEQQLVDAEKGNVIASTKGKPQDDKLTTVVKYAQAIGNLTSQVISFWQQANQAEAEALDRSIALQEKRVDAAQKIADRGNAQYLKMEEDRLKAMQVQRENAARKQLGINAALQGSEILVALISGIASAVKTTGPLGAIIGVAAVAAAIAGAFAIAQSLKPPQPTFFKGTKDTGRGGAKDSKGGFTATLHPNEAVLPADKNKKYKPTVAAIYDGTVPAEALNAFVKNYHTIKAVPLPNYQRIKEAAELKINSDGRMSILLSEHSNLLKESNELQRAILKKKGVHAELNVDKNGVGMMVTEYMEQLEINKRI